MRRLHGSQRNVTLTGLSPDRSLDRYQRCSICHVSWATPCPARVAEWIGWGCGWRGFPRSHSNCDEQALEDVRHEGVNHLKSFERRVSTSMCVQRATQWLQQLRLLRQGHCSAVGASCRVQHVQMPLRHRVLNRLCNCCHIYLTGCRALKG